MTVQCVIRTDAVAVGTLSVKIRQRVLSLHSFSRQSPASKKDTKNASERIRVKIGDKIFNFAANTNAKVLFCSSEK